MAPTEPGTSSSSDWQSIRPWNPRLALSVREITSVSATFILSSAFSENASNEPAPSFASLGLVLEDGDSDDSTKNAVISDALAKGLSVNVNGTPWKRVLIRLDDHSDSAVIIIYGLMPGRQYDVDLGLVQGQQNQNSNLHRQVTTEDPNASSSDANGEADGDISTSSEQTTSVSTPSSSPRSSPTPPPSSSSQQLTLEDRLHQLQHTLSLMSAERNALTAALKAARRDAQKADAALRSEIDVLKRASEKHVAAEHRARQKVLSLQEAVKRAQSATKEMEQAVREVESSLPGVRQRRDERESAYVKVKEEADRVKRAKEKEGERDKKRVDGMRGELAGLTNKFERVNVRREKLEGNTLPDLEDQLREIQEEIERVEGNSYEGHEFGPEDLVEQQPSEHQAYEDVLHSYMRPKQSSSGPGTIGRPAPIQRPSGTGSALRQLWSPVRSPVTPKVTASSPSLLSSRAAPFEPGRSLRENPPRTLRPGLTTLPTPPMSAPLSVQRPAQKQKSGDRRWASAGGAQ